MSAKKKKRFHWLSPLNITKKTCPLIFIFCPLSEKKVRYCTKNVILNNLFIFQNMRQHIIFYIYPIKISTSGFGKCQQSEFRSFQNTKKVFRVLLRNGKNRFVSYFHIFLLKCWTFSSIFAPFIRVSHLLFVFRVFFSSCVPFFEFHTVLTHQWQ